MNNKICTKCKQTKPLNEFHTVGKVNKKLRAVCKECNKLYLRKDYEKNPEKYRGLDSHYWSIYHGDFKLETCLHVLNNKLDDGKIIFKKCIKLKKNLRIFQLRELNTINCIDIALNLFRLLHLGKKIKTTKQKNIGRYYSFMPSLLKINLEKKFLNYCNKLK